jgi:hypothetical protein
LYENLGSRRISCGYFEKMQLGRLQYRVYATKPYSVKVAEGYKIHLTSQNPDREAIFCVKKIVEEHGLSSREDRRGIMIYRKR